MNTKVTTLAALLLSVLLSNGFRRWPPKQTSPPSATATRPAKTPPEQTSIPNASPASHNNSDNRREQPGCDGQKNERRRKAEGRHEGQIA